jgi:hypothetical protein
VHPLGSDGAIGDPPFDRHDTAAGAHAIATDPSNRFAFVPHISRLQDNVLEPPKNNPGPNFIAQFRFDAQSGRLTPNEPFRVEQEELVGPRHYCFHPTRDLVYFSDEQGCALPPTHGRCGRARCPPYKGSAPCRTVPRTEHLLPRYPERFGGVLTS